MKNAVAHRRGIVFIVSSPSGGGKTTLLRRICAHLDDLVDSVSYTTRPMRTGEADGVDYRFLDEAGFDARVEAGFFAEWAVVHGHRYGTSRGDLEDIVGRGLDAVMDIDVQGARQLKGVIAEAVTVFILPPSLTELERRLRARGTESDESLGRRIDAAAREMQSLDFYEYLVVNDELDDAARRLEAIFVAERQRTRRYDMAAFRGAVASGGGR
jgi:guanylate kinase